MCRYLYASLILEQALAVGRIYGVSHHNSELFALRRLLSVVRGAQSFQDMATFNGVVHISFREACLARGLLTDDAEWIAAMSEVVELQVSIDVIRRQFARILVHGNPENPKQLFDTFVDDLCDDSCHQC